jgi:hypothetical protein
MNGIKGPERALWHMAGMGAFAIASFNQIGIAGQLRNLAGVASSHAYHDQINVLLPVTLKSR